MRAMSEKAKRLGCLAVALAAVGFAANASAEAFDWKKHQGETITFLANTNPIGNSIIKYKGEFEQLTGIKVKVDPYQEQQMRQRLVTVMNAQSDEIDLFMSLPSREGLQFAKAGWYAGLNDVMKGATADDYDFPDLSPAMVKDATYQNQVMGIPLNVEGPVLWYRKDVLDKCGVALPKSLAEMEGIATQLKKCDPAITPFVSRGLKPAAPFTFSVFLHNMGGHYMSQRKSQMCSTAGQAALGLYGRLLKDFGPPGVVNYSFYQISALYKDGRAAMAFESSNELHNMMEGGARAKDTGVALLPPGPGGSHPTVIGWTMSISAYSKHKEAAWYFLQWATGKEMEKKLALEGIAPPRASIAQAPQFKAWIDQEPVRKEWIEAINELSRTGTSEVGYPIVANPASREFIGQAIDEVLLGQKPVAQACADADRALDALIAKD